jgi:hypothetical protein
MKLDAFVLPFTRSRLVRSDTRPVSDWLSVCWGCLLLSLLLPFVERRSEASGSLYFNGPSTYAQFAEPFALPANQFTLEFWCRPDSLNQSGDLFHQAGDYDFNDRQSYVLLGFQADGHFYIVWGWSDLDPVNANSPPNMIIPLQWHHVAVTETMSLVQPPFENLCIYVNGALVYSNLLWQMGDGAVQWLGQSIPQLARTGFAGDIGEFRIWNRALSQSEIQSKMVQILNPTNETGLAGYWRFTEGTGNIAHDLAGTNNATIYGATWSSDLPGSPLQPPAITQQPASQTVSLHASNVVFGVGVIASTPRVFQWLFSGTNIPGATSDTLEITNARLQDLGSYSVVVSNWLGSATSSNATLSMYPFLSAPFTGTTVIWGKDVTLTVGAAGTGPFNYQWYKDSVAVGGATNATLNFTGIQFTNGGMYSVVVTSPFGSVTNAPAQVVVNPSGVSIAIYTGITIDGVVGLTYGIQSSTDLSNTNGWRGMVNVTLSTPTELWFDVQPANQPQRYYRVVPGPISVP